MARSAYGPFLEISHQGRKVGVIGLCFGYPILVDSIQGYKGNKPKDFFMATRKSFEIALIDFLIKKVGHLTKGKPWKGPKIGFSAYALEKISPATRNRLTTRYMNKTEGKMIIRHWLPKELQEARIHALETQLYERKSPITVRPAVFLRTSKKKPTHI
ncbi:MAG: hypothetical protein NTY48_06330 [Candidatus Diapherotrites archaeon]|nr:hypothetical protein [Candidatus Diapherotrites archaeon]